MDYTNPIKITMVIGELSQVIINLLNNFCDAHKDSQLSKLNQQGE